MAVRAKRLARERWFYRDPEVVWYMAGFLRECGTPACILCVGTPRVAGDRLGPITGSFLRDMKVKTRVYGTLEDPVHSLNIRERIADFRRLRPLLVIDSTLSNRYVPGTICAGVGETDVGSGGNEPIPVGDLYIHGVAGKYRRHGILISLF